MIKNLLSKIGNDCRKNTYYDCEDLARSYRDFGVPYSLAVEWIHSKVNASEKVVEQACDHVYYHSRC